MRFRSLQFLGVILSLSGISVLYSNCSGKGFEAINQASSSQGGLAAPANLKCSVGEVSYDVDSILKTYSSATAIYPALCSQVDRTCKADGKFDGAIISACAQSCLFPGDKVAVAVGATNYFAASSSATCIPTPVNCMANGQFNVALPSTAVSSCSVVGQTCSYANAVGIAVPTGYSAGDSVFGYKSKAATFPSLCSDMNVPNSAPSICQSSGSWSKGAPLYSACTQSCSLNGLAIAQGVYHTVSTGTASDCSATVTCQANGQFSPALPTNQASLFSQCTVIAAPVWTINPEISFVVGQSTSIDLSLTLPAGVVKGGGATAGTGFSVDPSGAKLPIGMSLSPSGILSLGTAAIGSTAGVIFSYTEP